MSLNHEGKIELLGIARRTLETYLDRREIPEARPVDPGLLQPGGAFVTLEKDGVLRGCIGRMTADRLLFLTVQDAAVQAAVSDPRFPAVILAEVPEIVIEISALSPLQVLPRDRVTDIEVGRHGIVVTLGDRRGLLLPQVAARECWDRDRFLAMTCRKAGIPQDAWQDPRSRIEIFTAAVFSERDFFK